MKLALDWTLQPETYWTNALKTECLGNLLKALIAQPLLGSGTKKKELKSLDFHLLKNGEKVQEGSPSQMFFDIDTIIEYVSKFMTLKKGDLIYTGTPAGVGKIESGDLYQGYLNGQKTLELRVL